MGIFSIPCTSQAESVFIGVRDHQQKRTHSREAPGDNCSHTHQEPAWIIHKSQTGMQEGRKCIKADKGAHQEQNGPCGSSLRRGPEEHVALMNVPHSLLVFVEDVNNATAGPQHQAHEQDIRT